MQVNPEKPAAFVCDAGEGLNVIVRGAVLADGISISGSISGGIEPAGSIDQDRSVETSGAETGERARVCGTPCRLAPGFVHVHLWRALPILIALGRARRVFNRFELG